MINLDDLKLSTLRRVMKEQGISSNKRTIVFSKFIIDYCKFLVKNKWLFLAYLNPCRIIYMLFFPFTLLSDACNLIIEDQTMHTITSLDLTFILKHIMIGMFETVFMNKFTVQTRPY